MRKINVPEHWKRYKDTDIYVSDMGRAKRIYKNGKERELGHLKRRTQNNRNIQIFVSINKKEVRLSHMIYTTFKGEIPKGFVVAHKNGLKTDNSIYNLYLTDRRKLGLETGHLSNHRMVINKETGKVYETMKSAGKKLFLSDKTVQNYCTGVTKNPQVDLWWWDEELNLAYRGEWHKPIVI